MRKMQGETTLKYPYSIGFHFLLFLWLWFGINFLDCTVIDCVKIKLIYEFLFLQEAGNQRLFIQMEERETLLSYFP